MLGNNFTGHIQLHILIAPNSKHTRKDQAWGIFVVNEFVIEEYFLCLPCKDWRSEYSLQTAAVLYLLQVKPKQKYLEKRH